MFQEVKRILPGHGEAGDSSLLDCTRKLFTKQNKVYLVNSLKISY